MYPHGRSDPARPGGQAARTGAVLNSSPRSLYILSLDDEAFPHPVEFVSLFCRPPVVFGYRLFCAQTSVYWPFCSAAFFVVAGLYLCSNAFVLLLPRCWVYVGRFKPWLILFCDHAGHKKEAYGGHSRSSFAPIACSPVVGLPRPLPVVLLLGSILHCHGGAWPSPIAMTPPVGDGIHLHRLSPSLSCFGVAGYVDDRCCNFVVGGQPVSSGRHFRHPVMMPSRP